VTVSPPPTGAIVGKCEMRLRVSLPGRQPVELKSRDVALAVERWPRVGQTLPVDVEPNRKHVKVRWDLIDQGYARASDPTPPRPYQSSESDTARRDTAPSVRLHTQYADPSLNEYVEEPAYGEDATVQTPAPAVDPFAEATAGDEHDPLEVIHSDFDPADVDRSDFELDPTEPGDPPGPVIPTPRPAERPTMRITGPSAAAPSGDDATTGDADSVQTRDGAPIGGMLIVSDLDRSLRFYSETLGFTIVYAASSNAVVEHGGARILLQHMADFSGIDRKVGHLHIQVLDLEAAYTDLLAKGVHFRYRPKMVSRSDDLELWKAAFDDPDGHGVALTEWRQRR
jgi:catechol 2,3-dioxygenase-like lactoylglutathione lyase family enzyme